MSNLRKALSVGLAHLAYTVHSVDVFAQLKWLKETEKWTLEQRGQWQLARLNEILAFTWKNVPFYFGGTSLLIIVVVTMDFMTQVQAYMMSQQYESLLKKANFKGGLPTR